ncbi:hypothetical protein LF1_31810 [Rubripirellula obstinata]|uniref:Uncharacterized protein n=1 Tax=Rubripirellula obstinata TaxID=406547 RepID=A0A5B1CK21_9BACT|nr:hypothetical protein LF1_31810 [Rubripirellula obstinata]
MLNCLFAHVPDFLIENSLFDIRCSPTVHTAFGNKLVAKNNHLSTLLSERHQSNARACVGRNKPLRRSSGKCMVRRWIADEQKGVRYQFGCLGKLLVDR